MLGYGVELLSTLERRLELLEELGVEETLVVEFTPEIAATGAEAFAQSHVLALGAEVVVAGRRVPLRAQARRRPRACSSGSVQRRARRRSSPASRRGGSGSSSLEGDVRGAAALLGRPVEVEGLVVSGDARGGTLGFPTANLRVDRRCSFPRSASTPARRSTIGPRSRSASTRTTAASERRVEAFLLDFEGDLYGQRVIVELWERLRDEAVFGSEAELIAQIARDVDQTRNATRP